MKSEIVKTVNEKELTKNFENLTGLSRILVKKLNDDSNDINKVLDNFERFDLPNTRNSLELKNQLKNILIEIRQLSINFSIVEEKSKIEIRRIGSTI